MVKKSSPISMQLGRPRARTRLQLRADRTKNKPGTCNEMRNSQSKLTTRLSRGACIGVSKIKTGYDGSACMCGGLLSNALHRTGGSWGVSEKLHYWLLLRQFRHPRADKVAPEGSNRRSHRRTLEAPNTRHFRQKQATKVSQLPRPAAANRSQR